MDSPANVSVGNDPRACDVILSSPSPEPPTESQKPSWKQDGPQKVPKRIIFENISKDISMQTSLFGKAATFLVFLAVTMQSPVFYDITMAMFPVRIGNG